MIIKGNGHVKIKDNFHSGKNCLMINSFHKYDDGNSIPYDSNLKVDKHILINENVWFGDNVMILGGIEIGEGAIIQAGSVVAQNVPKYAIAGGNPAKIFKYRNIDHYKKLKSENKIV
jgi:acetyltransferase-like isoleucine patch superfamily enzyme